MSGFFGEQDSENKRRSSYRYAQINTPHNFDVSSDFESSGKGMASPHPAVYDSGLPGLDAETDDCLPPSYDNYGTFSRKRPRIRTVISKLPEGDVPPYRAIFLVTNAAFGAGILNFPEAYMNAGGLGNALTTQFVSVHVCYRFDLIQNQILKQLFMQRQNFQSGTGQTAC